MIPGDIGRELAALTLERIAAGELPGAAAGVSADGTWRPAPTGGESAAGGKPGLSGQPGNYASSLPFELARLTGGNAARIGESLASGLREISWIETARVTGQGYLTVTVTTGHLAGLAARIAGGAVLCPNLTRPDDTDLARGADWRSAWLAFRTATSDSIAATAGLAPAKAVARPQARPRPEPDPSPAGDGVVARAIGYHGTDQVRYVLARTTSGEDGPIERALHFPLNVRNPFVAVRYAHANAASTLRWAADLGLAADPGAPAPAEVAPAELRLLDRLSWCPERLGAAGRRRRPALLTGYLEALAADWLECRERCPALPFGGAAAEADPAVIAWRLRLASAARTVLCAGLRSLGVAAPERI